MTPGQTIDWSSDHSHRRRIAAALLLGSAAIALFTSGATLAAPALPDPSRYPELSDKQLGQINAIVALADQPDSDWSRMGSQEPGQGGFDSYRYQIAMMSYALSLASYHYVPAYREFYEDADQRLIHKMMLPDVWGYWEETSRGSKSFDPSLEVLAEGSIDPVKDQNIMYSGHLFQMINTHEMLYNSVEYEKPNSIRFVYNPVGRGLGKQEFDYDNTTFAETLAHQFEANGWKGIACEPNAIFPECNQHPLLGYALYDKSHDTRYFPKISAAFRKEFDDLSYIDPKTSSFMTLYFIKQKHVVQSPAAWQDGWAGSFMHAWNPSLIDQIYPTQKARFLVDLPDGTATVKSGDQNHTYSWDHGFFAVLAAETGDTSTNARMLDYADKYWSPKWSDGALSYPRQDSYRLSTDGPNVWRRLQPLTANGLIALASVDYKNGLFELFNKPLAPNHFNEPFVTGVNVETTQVARAVYDAADHALVVTLRPLHGSDRAQSTWSVKNLDPNQHYVLWKDGREFGEVKKGVPVRQPQGRSEHIEFSAGDLKVAAAIGPETTFILMAA